MKYPILCAVICLFLIVPAATLAETDGDNRQANQTTDYELDQIVVTGTAVSSAPFDSPSDTDVLSGREKLERQSPSLGESIDYLPGLDTINTGSQFGKPVIRGLSGNRILVLQNGIGVNYQQYGVRHPPNVDPILAERIEVVQGASSILYGSSAIGGAINIIPRSIYYATGDSPEYGGRLSTGFATNNKEFSNSLEFDAASRNFGVTGAFVHRNSGNMKVPNADTSFEPGVPGDNPRFDGELNHTDFEQTNGSLRFGYRLDRGEITGRYEGWRNEHNFLLPDGGGIGQELQNDLVELSGRFFIGENWTAEPIFSYTSNLRRSNAPGNTLPISGSPPIEIERDSYTGRLNFMHGPAWFGFEGTLGAEVIMENQKSRGEAGLTPGGDVYNYSVYALERNTAGPLTYEIGLRYDYRKQEANPNDTKDQSLLDPDGDGVIDMDLKNSHEVLTGSFGLVYQLMDQAALAFNIGRGFRAPDLFELYANGVHGGVAAVQKGDPNLDPETSINTDISLRWRSPRLRAKLTVYRNAIEDYIFLRDTGAVSGDLSVLSWDQADAVLYGGNLVVDGDVTDWLNLRGTYQTVNGKFDDGPGNDLPLMPADKASIECRLHRDELAMLNRPYFLIKIQHAFSKDAAELIEPFGQFDKKPFGTASTDAYTVFDLKTGFRYKSIGLSVAVNNLFDEDYRDFLDTYKGYALSPGRNIKLSADWVF